MKNEFIRLIGNEPNNPLHYQIFSDWLQEQGDEEWKHFKIMGNAIGYGFFKFKIGETAYNKGPYIDTNKEYYIGYKIADYRLIIESTTYHTMYRVLWEKYAKHEYSSIFYERELLRKDEIIPNLKNGQYVRHTGRGFEDFEISGHHIVEVNNGLESYIYITYDIESESTSLKNVDSTNLYIP